MDTGFYDYALGKDAKTRGEMSQIVEPPSFQVRICDKCIWHVPVQFYHHLYASPIPRLPSVRLLHPLQVLNIEDIVESILYVLSAPPHVQV